MRGLLTIGLAAILMIACGQSKERDQAVQPKRNFHTDVLLKHTPVKDQGNSELCWAYAMLATGAVYHALAVRDAQHRTERRPPSIYVPTRTEHAPLWR